MWIKDQTLKHRNAGYIVSRASYTSNHLFIYVFKTSQCKINHGTIQYAIQGM